MRRFYDWFFPFYGIIERSSTENISAAIDAIDTASGRFKDDAVLDLCCGSGSLALALAPRCASYEGRDQSEGMLSRARARWRKRFGSEARDLFVRANVLDFADPEGSIDRIFMSYGLHLFPPEVEIDLLRRFFHAAKKSVVILDHETSPDLLLSLAEAMEGSWYQAYRRIDFSEAAAAMGARFFEQVVRGIRIMEFAKPGTSSR